jgi:hypothetical protein
MKVRESNRFELEQDILNAWKITDDISMLYENVMENESLDKDTIANALIGIQTIYSMRFERMWNTFEDMVSNKELDK